MPTMKFAIPRKRVGIGGEGNKTWAYSLGRVPLTRAMIRPAAGHERGKENGAETYMEGGDFWDDNKGHRTKANCERSESW